MKSYLKGMAAGLLVGASAAAIITPTVMKKTKKKGGIAKAAKALGTIIENAADELIG